MAITKLRSLTPEAFLRPELLQLSSQDRLMEVGLRMYADDHGRGRAIPALLRASLFPMAPEVTEEDVERGLFALWDARALVLYEVQNELYFQMLLWPTVQRPKRSEYPPPPASVQRHDNVTTPSGQRHGEGEREEREREESEWEWEAGGAAGHHHDDDEAPSPFCIDHEDTGGSDLPCRACGRRRLVYEVWKHKQRA